MQKLIAVASLTVALLAGFGSALGGVRLARATPALPGQPSLALTSTYGPVQFALVQSGRARQGEVAR
ncbi:hypothetical protein [Acidocella sp. C78]|uniref:hypothetical protein n=1 Tax=Acidocella sp. C78 TaxID=1671486 RepID=UPI0020BF7F3D|nr:hypothetical protein [Acidocella sp. C78]